MVRHLAHQAFLRQRLLEHPPHHRIFVLVFDLITALAAVDRPLIFCRDAAVFLAAEGAQRDIARRSRAGVEVLMQLPVWRYDHAALFLVVALDRRAVGPDERVALAAENNDVRAGSVAMADRKSVG